jgi:hypothetical protein
MNDPQIAHCVEKIGELVRLAEPSRRDVLQLGYNLGRLSELTGAGREPFWDRWKAPIATWDQPHLLELARQLHGWLGGGARPAPGSTAPDPGFVP